MEGVRGSKALAVSDTARTLIAQVNQPLQFFLYLSISMSLCVPTQNRICLRVISWVPDAAKGREPPTTAQKYLQLLFKVVVLH